MSKRIDNGGGGGSVGDAAAAAVVAVVLEERQLRFAQGVMILLLPPFIWGKQCSAKSPQRGSHEHFSAPLRAFLLPEALICPWP